MTYRNKEITEYLGRVEDFTRAADPIEPQYNLDAELWAKLRDDKPVTLAEWRVRLECGHAELVWRDLDWKPGDEPTTMPPEKLQKLKALLGDDDDFYGPRIQRGYPDPAPFTDCWTCRRWPPAPPPPPPPKPPTREELEARLRRAEAAQRRAEKRVEEVHQQLDDRVNARLAKAPHRGDIGGIVASAWEVTVPDSAKGPTHDGPSRNGGRISATSAR